MSSNRCSAVIYTPHNLFVISPQTDGIKGCTLKGNILARFTEKKKCYKKGNHHKNHFQQLLVCIIKLSIFLILKN